MEASLDRANRLLASWLETHPEDAAAVYNRGIVHHIREEFEDAYLDYEAVLERSPDNLIAYLSLGQAALGLERYAQAEAALQTGIRMAEESGANPAWGHLNLALVYQRSGRPEEAEEQFQAAIRQAPGIDWMYFFYARFLDSEKQTEAALEAYRKLIEVTQNKGWGYDLMGRFLSGHGLKAAALENYRRAVHAEPEDALLRARLALTYFELDDPDRSIQEFEAALEFEQDSYYVYASYGYVLDQTGRYREAAAMYERSLELRPEDDRVLVNLGRVYEILGEPERAREIYRKILSYADSFPDQALETARQRLSSLGGQDP
jgi:tetratricopeptide (TPR) repeat protein